VVQAVVVEPIVLEKDEKRFIRSTASLFFGQSGQRSNHFIRLRA